MEDLAWISDYILGMDLAPESPQQVICFLMLVEEYIISGGLFINRSFVFIGTGYEIGLTYCFSEEAEIRIDSCTRPP